MTQPIAPNAVRPGGTHKRKAANHSWSSDSLPVLRKTVKPFNRLTVLPCMCMCHPSVLPFYRHKPPRGPAISKSRTRNQHRARPFLALRCSRLSKDLLKQRPTCTATGSVFIFSPLIMGSAASTEVGPKVWRWLQMITRSIAYNLI